MKRAPRTKDGRVVYVGMRVWDYDSREVGGGRPFWMIVTELHDDPPGRCVAERRSKTGELSCRIGSPTSWLYATRRAARRDAILSRLKTINGERARLIAELERIR
jgi:hypothetical protein